MVKVNRSFHRGKTRQESLTAQDLRGLTFANRPTCADLLSGGRVNDPFKGTFIGFGLCNERSPLS